MTSTSSAVPVGNTAAAPASSSRDTSACGIVPPTTTAISPASAARSEVEAHLLPFRFEADLLGTADPAELADRARALSLLPRVSAQAPPFLIAHGDRDRIVPPAQSLWLHQALGRAGAASRLELLAGAGHEDARFDTPAMLASTAAWLRAVMEDAMAPLLAPVPVGLEVTAGPTWAG